MKNGEFLFKLWHTINGRTVLSEMRNACWQYSATNGNYTTATNDIHAIGKFTTAVSTDVWAIHKWNVPQNPISPVAKKKKNKGCGIAIGILAILAVFLIFIFAISDGDDADDANTAPKSSVSHTTTEEPVIEVSVEQILKEYEENEVAADNKYKGKKVAISGVVDSVSKDIIDDTYIKIDTGEKYEAFGAQCYIADTQFERVAELKPGDRITITGYVSSYSLNIVITDCEIQ